MDPPPELLLVAQLPLRWLLLERAERTELALGGNDLPPRQRRSRARTSSLLEVFDADEEAESLHASTIEIGAKAGALEALTLEVDLFPNVAEACDFDVRSMGAEALEEPADRLCSPPIGTIEMRSGRQDRGRGAPPGPPSASRSLVPSTSTSTVSAMAVCPGSLTTLYGESLHRAPECVQADELLARRRSYVARTHQEEMKMCQSGSTATLQRGSGRGALSYVIWPESVEVFRGTVVVSSKCALYESTAHPSGVLLHGKGGTALTCLRSSPPICAELIGKEAGDTVAIRIEGRLT